MTSSDGRECLIAHAPLRSAGDWTILNLIPIGDIAGEAANLTLIYIVAGGLLLLLLFDAAYMSGLNRKLRQTAEEADRANHAKTEFLSTMSHDIRTPMNAIIGLTTIAEKNVEDSESVKDNLHKISLASNHLLTLINDILDISKVESGKLNLTPLSFSIVETADNLVNISQPMVKEKNIDFSFRINRMDTEYLYADQLRLNQIFINILSNAIKYTEPGGRVSVDMMEVPSTQAGKVGLVYRVKDNGIGMSKEFMEVMYEPFSRETDSRVNSVRGTGLGLAITKQMVDLMGGSIDCESESGKGTTFTIRLDLPAADKQLEEMDLGPVSVFIADDDEILLETAKDALSSLGAKVESAQDAQEALDTICARHRDGKDYDVIIVDWKMPGMNGIDVIRKIRDEAGIEVPILLISAYDWSDIEDAAKEAGANGFISKPLFRSKLYNTLSSLLGVKSSITEPEEDNSDIVGMKILVAEDNDINWEIIEALLDMYGIKAVRAENGQVAVDMVKAATGAMYDLVFMDIQMPVMNGLIATETIRKLPEPDAAAVPIIAMTADAFSENVAACLAAGMDGHIAKPVDINIVLKEMRRIKESKQKGERNA